MGAIKNYTQFTITALICIFIDSTPKYIIKKLGFKGLLASIIGALIGVYPIYGISIIIISSYYNDYVPIIYIAILLLPRIYAICDELNLKYQKDIQQLCDIQQEHNRRLQERDNIFRRRVNLLQERMRILQEYSHNQRSHARIRNIHKSQISKKISLFSNTSITTRH